MSVNVRVCRKLRKMQHGGCGGPTRVAPSKDDDRKDWREYIGLI